MLDPQYPIIKAVKDALAGLTLPVYTTIPKGIDEYVLISQPTLVQGRGSAACLTWEATLMLSVYTKFVRDNASLVPALSVSGEIMNRLVGQRLDLVEFSMSPIEVQRLSLPQRFDDLNVYVQDNLRLRFEVYAEPTVSKPAGKLLADYTVAEVLAGYPQLAALGPLNCPAPIVCPPTKTIDAFTVAEVLGYPRLSELGPLNCPAPALPKTINDFTAAEVLTYARLDQLGALNCPVPEPAPTGNILVVSLNADSENTYAIPVTTLNEGKYQGYEVAGGTGTLTLAGDEDETPIGSTAYFQARADQYQRLVFTRTSGAAITFTVHPL